MSSPRKSKPKGEGISVKLCTNTDHVSGYCWKGFQSQRSKMKVI